MNNNIMKYIQSFDDKNYLSSIIECISAPTIMGIKPATLINFSKNKRELNSIWSYYKDLLVVNSNLNFFELKCTKENSIVLFYNYVLLEKLICKKENKILQELGYKSNNSLEVYLANLSHRYYEGCPHEIGLFLGFPYDDVHGFIENKGRNYLYSGYWKVYYNLKIALNTFEKYDVSKKIIENNILRRCR